MRSIQKLSNAKPKSLNYSVPRINLQPTPKNLFSGHYFPTGNDFLALVVKHIFWFINYSTVVWLVSFV